VVARTTDGGAIAYWRGYLWFGSINNNGITISAHSNCDLDICYGAPETDEEAIDLLFNVHRPLSIWRARLDPDGTAEVELLYGSTELPVLIPGTKTFESKATGHTPLFGEAGFDNPFNRYTWTAVATDRLLFGVYDTRYVLDVRLGVISHNQMHDDPRAAPGSPAGLSGRLSDEPSGYGADLWRFDNENEPARPERARGIGNFANYGIRTMIPIGGGPDLLLGTANALNIEAEGGWELHLLTAPQENAEF
jgi:hypothetical protein